jgi:hypothetical protein
MVEFNTTIQQFAQQGEKTGWTYILIPADTAQQLIPGNKKTFRVKGFLDNYKVEGIALLPMGNGDFIMALNASIRKGIKKGKGTLVNVRLQIDEKPILPPADFINCLKDEPQAYDYFHSITKGNQNYFSNWIKSAKTDHTRTKRIAQSITALSRRQDFGEMLRALKRETGDF